MGTLADSQLGYLESDMMCIARNHMGWVRNKKSHGLGHKKCFPVTSGNQEGFLSHRKVAGSTPEPQRSPKKLPSPSHTVKGCKDLLSRYKGWAFHDKSDWIRLSNIVTCFGGKCQFGVPILCEHFMKLKDVPSNAFSESDGGGRTQIIIGLYWVKHQVWYHHLLYSGSSPLVY